MSGTETELLPISTSPEPVPAPPQVSYVRIEEILGGDDSYTGYAICRTADGHVVVYRIDRDGGDDNYLERHGHVDQLREMVAFVEAHPGGTFNEGFENELAFGEWYLDDRETLHLSLPCGDGSFWPLGRFKAFLRTFEELQPISATLADAPSSPIL